MTGASKKDFGGTGLRMNGNKIPLMIGVTGHLNPRKEDLELLRVAVKRELVKLREQYPHTPAVMLCALARGGDLLCAEAAEELGIPLRAVLPMDRDAYEKDFSPEDLKRMQHQAERAETVFTVPAAEADPAEESRNFRYRQAGIYVAEHSQILLALWDGKEGSRFGTGAAVRAALEGAWIPKRGIACRHRENAGVLHIMTPLEGDSPEEAGAVRWLGNREILEDILSKTEEFNQLAEELPEGDHPLLPEDTGDPEIQKLETLYSAADRLSLRFAQAYRRTLRILAVMGTVTAFSFLLYDEANLFFMILLCGISLVSAMLAAGAAKRMAVHRRYIEYRALAEALRVQLYLRYAGSRTETQRIMAWTQQQETPWILCALCAVNAGKAPEQTRDVRESWVEGQRAYHEKTGKRSAGQSGRNDRLVRIAAICAATLYFGGLAFELLCGGLIFAPTVRVQHIETWRTVLKILLGTVTVGTLFLASSYGQMSVERNRTDHRKMEAFYAAVGRQMERLGQTEELLETLAREELTENGNWCSYQRDNAPELNL